MCPSSDVDYHTVGDTLPSKLLEYLDRAAKLDAEFIIFDDGYRGWTYRYADVAGMANAIRVKLRAGGVRKGDTALIWSESRAGWVAALWACLADGVIVAPVDPQSSIGLFERIAAKAGAKITFLGERVPPVGNAWRLAELEQERAEAPAPVAVEAGDVAEIVFTSGTTAEPKGVVITHRNLLANLDPVAGEIAKYTKYAGPFLPLRILNLLPLSHLFGQSLALYLPPLIPASVVFLSGTGAHEIVRQIRARKISALIAVPKVLEVLRDFVTLECPEVDDPRRARGKWPMRWWRFRRVHRLFGFKFWAFISGGAPLAPEVEQFWAKLGFVVVQGYGLTETAPIVTLSHPFHVKGGTVGKPLAGVDVKIAEDGEILVRGDNVTTGYFESPEETAKAFEAGWFHTGDIGEMDSEGNLLIRGRKKEMIVTPEGLKVFPEDVEKVLDATAGVREAAVIGKDRVHAVLVLEPGANADEIVRTANAKLEDAQRVRSFSIWPGEELPRTQSTRKLRRGEIAETIRRGSAAPAKSGDDLIALVQKYAPGRTITPETTLDELGLSSLERVQLMLELEEKRSADVDEGAFSSAVKVADLAMNTGGRPAQARSQPIPFPTYSRTLFARAARRVALPFWLLPMTRIFAHIHVSGRENLAAIRRPVIFASNHQSYFDVPVILAAMPGRFRYRVATAMSKEFFDKHFFPDRFTWREWFTNSLNYYLATFFFNTFPLPQRHAGAGQSIRYMGGLIEQGWSILIFPEGDRTYDGAILPFQPGVGMIASHLETPVVPVRITGVDRVLNRTAWWPRMHRVQVTFGAPITLTGEDFGELAGQVEAAVRAL